MGPLMLGDIVEIRGSFEGRGASYQTGVDGGGGGVLYNVQLVSIKGK